MVSWFLSLDTAFSKTAIVLTAVVVLACADLIGRLKHRNTHMIFGCLLGTALAVGFIRLTATLFTDSVSQNAFAMALGMLLMVIAWKLLFGPWDPAVKATVLGTFVFWIALHMLGNEQPAERMIHLFAVAVAIIPAVVWCFLFLPYHSEKISCVLTMFFSGMLATAPILMYDALVRSSSELQFFYFRIVPESFNTATQTFVSGQIQPAAGVSTTLWTLFLSFICVAIVEEGSKYWVLKKSGGGIFSSIDETMELAIIVAIGFAFAENVLNSGYFVSFVKEYLVGPQKDWMGFLGNVAGRSVLTSMVHIVSTGVLGYCLGRALFAGQLREERKDRGPFFRLSDGISEMLGLDRLAVYRSCIVLAGFSAAVFLHAFSNFMVTLPEALPGNPHTIGELLGAPAGSWLNMVSLVLFPSLLYVVGGFWLLTWLFERKENRAERGHLSLREEFVMA